MVYQIIDWLLDNLDEDDFKSEEEIKQAALALDDAGKIKGFMDSSTDWYNAKHTAGKFDRKPISGNTLSGEVIRKNEEYKKNKEAEIERVTTLEELERIKIDTDYEKDTQLTLQEAIKDKKGEIAVPIKVEIAGEEFEIPVEFQPGRPRQEVRDIVGALAGETFEQIITAESLEELEAIEIPTNIPKSTKSFLRSELRAARREFG